MLTRESGVFEHMYESKHQAILPQLQFYKRLLGHCLIAFLVVMGSLCAGMLGFMYFEDMAWHDASMHAFFLLAGLGTITVPESVSGKLFLGVYGLYAGLVFVAVLGIILAPVAHRILHSFHLDAES